METKCVKLTMPKKLYEEGSKLVKEFGYSNLQDLTLEGLRKELFELRKKQALINLKKNFGSVKPRPRLTKEQKEKIAREHTPERAKEITKRYGLSDIAI